MIEIIKRLADDQKAIDTLLSEGNDKLGFQIIIVKDPILYQLCKTII